MNTTVRLLLNDITEANPNASRGHIYSIFFSQILSKDGKEYRDAIVESWISKQLETIRASGETKPRIRVPAGTGEVA